ncbi:MAG: N-acetyltransferase [Alphaproteobacteria bacterium]|nr:MAG: N-acetyltransferase [Alphaproteobacteria bacterium]
MSKLRPFTSIEPEHRIEGEGVYLRYPAMSDYVSWAALRHESHDFLQPWEPTWPVDDLTRPSYRRRLRRYAKDIKEDLGYPFFIFRNRDDALLGGCNVSNVRRGISQACSLGYWMGKPYAGSGLMTAAVRALVPYILNDLRLHRIEAACLPSNEPSKRLLTRVGFSQEGQARRYLKINGEWRDHVLFAILSDDISKAEEGRV